MEKGRASPGLHPQHWQSKESTINKRKTVSEEIHHLEEVRRIPIVVGQKKRYAWTKWEYSKDRAVTWGELKHIESKKLHSLTKAVYDILPTPVNFHAWGINYIRPMQSK